MKFITLMKKFCHEYGYRPKIEPYQRSELTDDSMCVSIAVHNTMYFCIDLADFITKLSAEDASYMRTQLSATLYRNHKASTRYYWPQLKMTMEDIT